MPLVLALRSPEIKPLFQRRDLLKTLGVLALVLATAELIFSVTQYPLLFLLYPVLVMTDSLLGFPGSAIAVTGICLVAVYNATNGHGPFGRWPENRPLPRDAALQIYLGFHTVSLFPASILLMERKRMTEELRKTNLQLNLLVSRDALTGIANRRALDDRIIHEWKRAARAQSWLALLMIDIDHFKQFNDQQGHPAGDLCLRTVAEALSRQARDAQDLVARFGGEEFALLLPDTDLAAALQMGERMRAAVYDLGLDHGASPLGRVTISVGCAALRPGNATDPAELLRDADAALYGAKRRGRNRVEINPEEHPDPAPPETSEP
jgi:diguanylate cyclase (GGDEF)-like protein